MEGFGLAAVLALVAVAAGALSCVGPFAATQIRTPEIVGVIDSSDFGADSLWHVLLADGQKLSLRRSAAEGPGYAPLDGGGTPRVGDLLIAGNEPTPWYTSPAHLTNLSDYAGRHLECYMLDGSGKENTDSFDFDYGLRLAKAPDFDPVGANGHDFSGGACLDAQGRVKSVGYQGN